MVLLKSCFSLALLPCFGLLFDHFIAGCVRLLAGPEDAENLVVAALPLRCHLSVRVQYHTQAIYVKARAAYAILGCPIVLKIHCSTLCLE